MRLDDILTLCKLSEKFGERLVEDVLQFFGLADSLFECLRLNLDEDAIRIPRQYGVSQRFCLISDESQHFPGDIGDRRCDPFIVQNESTITQHAVQRIACTLEAH